jgi:hypothetical protein
MVNAKKIVLTTTIIWSSLITAYLGVGVIMLAEGIPLITALAISIFVLPLIISIVFNYKYLKTLEEKK